MNTDICVDITHLHARLPTACEHTHTHTPIEVLNRASDEGHHFVCRDFRHGHICQDALVVKVYDNGITDDVRTPACKNTGDLNALQSALSSGFEADLTQEDLEADLELVLSEDALCPAAFKRRVKVAVPATEAEPAAVAAEAEPDAVAAEAAPEKEPAPQQTLEAPLPEVAEPAQVEMSVN
jgi:hypothetical protein